MTFSDFPSDRREGRFFVYENMKGKASSALLDGVFAELWRGFNHHRSNIELSEAEGLVFAVGDAEIPEVRGYEYAISVTTGGFAVASDTKDGLIRGFMTLLDRIHPTDEGGAVGYLDCCMLRQSPRIANRMVHFCVFPETDLFYLHRFLRLCASLKYTHVVVEFWGMIKLDCMAELAWPFAFTKDEVRPIMAEAKTLGLEIIPMFNHWGHASLSRAIHGKHVVLDQNPTLVTLFEEGGWCWKISDARVRELFRKIRAELMELAGEGSYFHIGCDEADGYDMKNPKERETVLEFLNEVAEELAEHGRRPIMWGDMLIFKHQRYDEENKYFCASPSEECEKYMFSHLDKRFIIADWQYLSSKAPIETSLTVNSYGYDTLVCPFDFAVEKNVAVHKTVVDGGLFGFMHTTWHRLSIGMPFVTMMAVGGYEELSADNNPVLIYRYKTAELLRKVMRSDGTYEHAGWSRKQTEAFTN